MKTISRKSGRVMNPKKRLLEFFLEKPTHELYESQIRKATSISLGAANKYLKELSREKLIILRKIGRMNLYKLNRESGYVKRMKIAHSFSLPVISMLKKLGERLGIEMFVYGSTSRGEDVENSDLDVLIIGNIKLHVIEKEMIPIRKKSEKKIKSSIFTRREWISMSKKDPTFFERVEKDKVRIE